MIYDVLSVLVLVTIVEILAVLVLYLVAVIFDARRKPPEWDVPDFVPDDWDGGDAEQTSPDARPRS